jgi:predicted GNAT family acetyltransferase
LSYRVQSYSDIGSWEQEAWPFLKKEEGWNNLFWQVLQNWKKSIRPGWLGNVYHDDQILMSALQTPSNYLLLSHGNLEAVEALVECSIHQRNKYNGIHGPKTLADHYLRHAQKIGLAARCTCQRSFKLFETSKNRKNKIFWNYKLKEVSDIDWPRARVWAQSFAMEAVPPMNLSAIVQMAKQMRSAKNLFMLMDPQNYPCAMAGYGRSTDRYRVINMVYVPEERRGEGIGKELITRMKNYAQKSGYEECLLFSEWEGPRNLYDSAGCKTLGKFVEYDLI